MGDISQGMNKCTAHEEPIDKEQLEDEIYSPSGTRSRELVPEIPNVEE